MKIYKKNNYVYYENGNDKFFIHESELDFKDKGNNEVLVSARPTWAYQGQYEWVGNANQILNKNGEAYGTTLEDVIFGFQNPLDIRYNDQITRAIIAYFNRVTNSTTLTVQPSIGDYTITVNDATGAATGSYIVVYNPTAARFCCFHVVSVAGNVITLDSPVDFAYPVGTYVDIAITDMNVNGSVTPVVYGIRGSGVNPGVDVDIDITRILIHCQAASAVDLSKFGDLAALTKGLVLRTRNDEYHNIFNIKSNGELAGICYDFSPYVAATPSQGQDGFQARLTFAGPSKIGVAIRIPEGTDMEFIVQDNLSTLTHLHIVAEGHVVEK